MEGKTPPEMTLRVKIVIKFTQVMYQERVKVDSALMDGYVYFLYSSALSHQRFILKSDIVI